MKLFKKISATFMLLEYVSAGGCRSYCLDALEGAASQNNYAIRLASNKGDLKAVTKLLSRPGVDPTANNNEAIQHASANGHLEVVKLLLSRPGVDPTANNNAAIQLASNGHLEVVKLLLSRPGVDPTANNNAAIQLASANGHLEVVKHLLAIDGVDPTVFDNFAIRMASRYGHLESVKELLSRPGVDPTANQNDAIRSASLNGHLQIVELLLSQPGVDPTDMDNEAIRFASEKGHLEIVKLLLSIDRVNPAADNNDAIQWASANGHIEVVKELLSSTKVDPSDFDSLALSFAFEYNHIDIVKLLINDGRVDPTINNLALFLEATQRIQKPSLKSAERKIFSDIASFLEGDRMVSSILFLQSNQELTPTRFLEMINFERAWIHDSYIEKVLRFPQVTELLSGILGIDRAVAVDITSLKRLNDEMAQLMKSLEEDMNFQRKHAKLPEKSLSLVSKKRWNFVWQYFGALREYSEEKVALRKKLGFLQRKTEVVKLGQLRENASPPGENLDSLSKNMKSKDVPGDNASRFNQLTVWKLQNMIALPVPVFKEATA